jgi:streptogramin lyase
MYVCMRENKNLMKYRTTTLGSMPRTIAFLLAINALRLYNTQAVAAGRTPARTDVVFTDSQAAVLKTSTSTHGAAVVAEGQRLDQPFGICVCPSGEYLVTDTGCLAIIGVNPANGTQRVVSSGGMLGVPFGIATERNGSVLVANAQSLIRIDPQTGAQSVASSGGLFQVPIAVAVAANGNVFVADIMGSIIQVNPRTGQQTLVSSGGYLKRPQGIAVKGHDIYVTDVATSDGNFGIGRLIHVNAQNGRQTVLSEGGYLVGPVGISLSANGDLIVADPYTINEESQTLFDGSIIMVDSSSGRQTLVARGQEGFVNPRCVAVLKFSAVE